MTGGAMGWRRRERWRVLALLVMVPAALYLAVLVGMVTFQRQLAYNPNPAPVEFGAEGPVAERVVLAPSDGNGTMAYWSAPKDPVRPVFLYLHGNAQNLSTRAARLAWLAADGSGILAVSWRGYGGSPGSPSEAGLKADARAGYDWVMARVPAARIVIVGESLGTMLAIDLAAKVPARALILDSPFSSAVDVGAARYPWLPVRLLMADQYRADEMAPRVTIPVLAINCRIDPVTPFRFAEKLLPLFPNPVTRFILDESCHVPPLTKGGAAAIASFLAGLGFPARP